MAFDLDPGQLETAAEKQKVRNMCIVRLRTEIWADKRGMHTKKSLVFMRKQCQGFNILEEDIGAVGARDVMPKIINLEDCEDGLYEAVACNESTDWESGHIDSYDYKLVPIKTISALAREGA